MTELSKNVKVTDKSFPELRPAADRVVDSSRGRRVTRPNLPDFGTPPVTEVVLSVQFEKLPGLRTAHVGLLWNEFRDRFPKIEERVPLDPVFERFDQIPLGRVGVRIESFATPPLARVWFLNVAGTQLIQVQPDRLIHNWRKVGDEDEYPRYEPIRDAFLSEFETFAHFVAREQLGTLTINQCEITYVNHIAAGRSWQRHGQLATILGYWNDLGKSSFLPEAEDVAVEIKYIIRVDGDAIGRLHATVRPGWRTSDKKPLYILELTARGAPRLEGVAGAQEFFDIGREWIVRGFAAMTTSTMHSEWERRDA